MGLIEYECALLLKSLDMFLEKWFEIDVILYLYHIPYHTIGLNHNVPDTHLRTTCRQINVLQLYKICKSGQ